MDSTAAFAPDSAFQPDDVLPSSSAQQPLQADTQDTPSAAMGSATHWLSQAMALWMQPTDALPDGAPTLTPSRATH
jgi:hypothetical protein